ncbi:MAG: hypothetical protein QOD61_953 [Solirubrobacteraceae bacterium]|jgi:hypothetical protein|nr:hypothetical protein [Solirubrobacteraceae bacterium]MEA2354824.1 hypothetical protein [Solirubrobacteraceae bacterium]
MTRHRLWPVISILVGMAFAIEAVAGAGGLAFAITGIAAGAMYAIAGSLTRGGGGGRGRDRARNRDRR